MTAVHPNLCTIDNMASNGTVTTPFASSPWAASLPSLSVQNSWGMLRTQSQHGTLEAVRTLTTQGCRLALAGHLALPARQTLHPLIEADLARGIRHFILDLADLTFLDSSGLSAFVVCLSLIRQHRGTLQLTHVPAHVYEFMEVTGLLRLFDLCQPVLSEAMSL